MPGIDERLTRELHRLGDAGDPEGWDAVQAFERIAARKARRRTARRLETASLAVVVLLATVAGSYGLWKILGVGRATKPHPATSVEGPVNGKIAFVRSHQIDTTRSLAAVYTVNPDGSGLAKLSGDDEAIADLAWSPDGARLAFAATQGSTGAEKGETQIYVMNADGSDLTQLTRDPSSQNIEPAWSPDGTRIAYAKWSNDVDPSGLYVIGADGNGETRLTSSPIDTSPTWFPDGSRILFVRSPEGISELHVVNADGTEEHALAEPSGGYVGSVVISPDGTRMAFTRLEPDIGQKNFEIFVANTDGTGEVRLTHTPAPEGDPSWSPDGTRITFTREGNIYTMGTDGSGVRQVTNSGSDGWPTWQRASTTASSEPTGVSPAPFPSPSPSVEPAVCDQSEITGDFDGDGKPDRFSLYVPRPASGCPQTQSTPGVGYHVRTVYSQGIVLDYPFEYCETACRAIGAATLGSDVLPVVEIASGASTSFLEFLYRNPAGGGPWTPIQPSDPGDPDFPLGQPARFASGGSATHYTALGCEGDRVISETAALNSDQTEWLVRTRTFRVGQGDGDVYPAFIRVLVADTKQPFDPDVSSGDVLEPGTPCWTEPTQG